MMRSPWLFSAPIDLGVFAGSAAVSLVLLALATTLAPSGATPEWTWITAVLLVDIAHVWSTAFVVYLDPVERARRRLLYVAVPVAAYAAGVALYAGGEDAFWRVLAYVAVFHFVRQQAGWVALYRAREGDRSRVGRVIDVGTIYAATLYPLAVWHSAPRSFAWFRDGDFAPGLPPAVATVAGVVYAALAVAYVARAVVQARAGAVPWGKHTVVATTAACWYLGIVATDSDYGFTVTNVLIHGVPYLALVYLYMWRTGRRRLGLMPLLATVWALAYAEELLWDRAVWHERAWLFGTAWSAEALRPYLVPLLAVPQLTHYVLDGFLWRRRSNPRVAGLFTP
jgi:hypothetical protein